VSREKCWILFHDDSTDLKAARAHLKLLGMKVGARDGGLTVRYSAEPRLFVHLADGKKWRTLREDLLESAPEETALAACDRAFVITFEDFDGSLDESNTLLEVQVELQELTRGYLYRSWNDSLVRPDGKEIEV
jgi:hypothetical protein